MNDTPHIVTEPKNDLEFYRDYQMMAERLYVAINYIEAISEFLYEYSAFSQSAMDDFEKENDIDHSCISFRDVWLRDFMEKANRNHKK